MNKSHLLGAVCAAGFLIISASAHAATITTYSNRITFDSAVGTTITEDFLRSCHCPIVSGVLNQFTNETGISPGDIQPGVTYSTPIGTGAFFGIDTGGGYDHGFLDSLTGVGRQALTIDFDSPVSAFGFDTNRLMGTNFDLTVNFIAGSAYTQNFSVVQIIPLEFLEFFGFQSALTDITSIVIQGNGHDDFNYAIDNFSFGGVSTVPIPAAIWLFGSGLLGLVGVARRKKAA